jgi:hypothetical protein
MKTALFLDDQTFIKALREILSFCDHFIALFSRLQTAWQGLDLLEDEGVVDVLTNYKRDEGEIWWEMERCGKLLEEKVTGLVEMIKGFAGADRGTEIEERLREVNLNQASGFVPFRGRTIDRLIMKLECLAGWKEGQRDADDVDP